MLPAVRLLHAPESVENGPQQIKSMSFAADIAIDIEPVVAICIKNQAGFG